MAIFGDSAWSIRLPAVIFGILAVPALYIFAHPITSRPVALGAALLLAVAYHSVWFAQNARGYTMLLFFAIAATHFLNNAVVVGTDRKANYTLYAICLALASYTHMTMVILGVVHGACVLGYILLTKRPEPIAARLWPAIAAFLGAAALTVALYAPMLGDVITFFMKDALAESGPKANAVETPGWALWVAVEELTAAFGGPVALLLGCTVLLVGGVYFLRTQPFLAATIVPDRAGDGPHLRRARPADLSALLLLPSGVLPLDRPAGPVAGARLPAAARRSEPFSAPGLLDRLHHRGGGRIAEPF